MSGKSHTLHRCRSLVASLVCLLLFPTVHSSSIQSVSLEEMIQNAEFVFEGRVIHSESRKNAHNPIIKTWIRFEILEVIKGDYDGSTLELGFLGGTSEDGMTLSVGDMIMPEPGEIGIYFVGSMNHSQVNPLYGWSQGHFLVVPDAGGVERIMTPGHQEVDSARVSESTRQGQLSDGVARGIQLRQSGDVSGGMTSRQFKQSLREMQNQP